MSKLLERSVYDQLLEHVNKCNILPEKQSGLRKGYSTTTALVDVVDDIMSATEESKLTCLISLDYSKVMS